MGKYDQAMKLIIAADPLAISKFILHYAEVEIQATGLTVVAMLNTEFEGYEVEADGLLLLRTSNGEEILLHIEFQSARDKTMPDRQLEYCLRARKKYGPLPIISCVIYLRPDGSVLEPPLCWQLQSGRKLLLFDYVCIKLWELPQEELLTLKQPALWPLVLLTKGEVNRTIIKEMFQSLLDNKLQDLFLVSEILAALVLKDDDLAWLKKELSMLTDIFKESPAYYWITEQAHEEGLAQGRAQAREQALEGFRQIAVALVIGRFPELEWLVRKQVYQVEDQGRLQELILQINTTQSATEVIKLLQDVKADSQTAE